MLKFTDHLMENITTAEDSDRIASAGFKKSPEPTKLKPFQSIAEIEAFVKKYSKPKPANNRGSAQPEYNAIYVIAGSNFIIHGANGFNYELTFATSSQNLPFFYLKGVGTTIDSVIQANTPTNKFRVVPDKHYSNVERFFKILNSWNSILANKTDSMQESHIHKFDSFLNEWTSTPTTNQTAPSPTTSAPIPPKKPISPTPVSNQTAPNPTSSAPIPPKKPMSSQNFLSMKLSKLLDRNGPFSQFKNFGEVLATTEILLGNKEKNMPKIIDDISIKDLLGMSNVFKKYTDVQKLNPLWYLKIKTVGISGTPEFKKVKFNTLIKNGSEIRIIKNKKEDAEATVKIDVKIQTLTEKDM